MPKLWLREMRRERIDRAVHAQLDRLTALLRDFDRSGGTDVWGHLWSHGHHWNTVKSATRRRYLRPRSTYRWTLTKAGRQYLADLDSEALRRQ